MIQHTHQSPQPPDRVVIVGASGFVGRDLEERLRWSGIETVPLSSKDVDLCVPTSVTRLLGLTRKGDAVVFVSALTPDRGKDAATFVRNVTMGLHMAAFLERAPCDHAVYIGSDAIYHDAANPVRETSCASPSGYHGLMHLVREHMLGEAARKSGCALVALRPSLLYGPRDTHNGYGPNRFLRTAMEQGKIVLFGEGEERRDHVNIGDFSRLIELCLLHRSTGVLNVATGEAVSFGDVARLVARAIGRPVAIEGSPRANPITHRHFDITALLKAFPGFAFTPLEVGLTQALGSAVLS